MSKDYDKIKEIKEAIPKKKLFKSGDKKYLNQFSVC